MARFKALAAGMALLILASAPTIAQDVEGEVDWLLVVQGRVAELRPGTIILDAPALAVAFTDRPAREVGFVDLRVLTSALWGEAGPLSLEPPNAAIVTGTGGIAIVEITDAIYDNDRLYLWVTLLEGEVPAVGDHLGITIDAFPTSVNGQITDLIGNGGNGGVGGVGAL